MEGALLSLLTPATLVFGTVIWLLVLILRKVVETSAVKIAPIFPDKYEPFFVEGWREWILPLSPIFLGGLVALLAPMYPFPEAFAASESGKLFFGIVTGGASGYVYRFMKFQFSKYLPEKAEEFRRSVDPDDQECDRGHRHDHDHKEKE